VPATAARKNNDGQPRTHKNMVRQAHHGRWPRPSRTVLSCIRAKNIIEGHRPAKPKREARRLAVTLSPMPLKDGLLVEFDHEIGTTRKLLERLPDDKLAWKPHDKSMSLGGLATHLSNLPNWGAIILNGS